MASSPYAALATQIAQKYGINPRVFAGLVGAESSWNPRARSSMGAEGLTQLMPATARGLGVSNPYDPRQNLEGGAKYLAQQLHAFGGDYSKALAAYNAGPNAVRKYGGVPPYAETQAYVKRILGGAKSGGPSSADPGAASAPAPGSPYPATLPGSIDAQRLYGILNAQRQRVLAGQMPAPNYMAELQKLVAQALPRQQLVAEAHVTGNAVGQVAGALAGGGGADDGGARYGTPFGTTFTLPQLPREVAPVRSTGTVKNPMGQQVAITTFDGKPVSAWWASMLTFARAHGWKGQVNSGYRSVAEQKRLFAAHPDPKWVAHPGSSPHNYAMAVDISDGPGLEKVIRAYHLPIARYAPEGWHFEPLGFRTNGTQVTFR